MHTQEDKKVYSPSEANYIAKQTLEEIGLWVEGEISSIQQDPKWFNAFFSLKDEWDLLPCFMEAASFANSGTLKVGDKILVRGYLTLFKKNEYKLKIVSIEESGEGILQKKFKELYEKLKEEGLFDQKHKKELPLYPKRICIVTSEGSAGWNDFKSKSTDKFGTVELSTADVRVSGSSSIKQLVDILPKLDKKKFDIIVVTRGGGAEEALMEVFNSEQVARAIFAMKTPNIVAIGHEINVSLAELVADVRASTPTDAANIAMTGYLQLLEKLQHIHYRLSSKAKSIFYENNQILDSHHYHLMQSKRQFQHLPHLLETVAEKLKKHQKYLIVDATVILDDLYSDAEKITKNLIWQYQKSMQNLANSLEILSPENTLSRGYAIAYDSKEQVLRKIDDVVVGNIIGVKLSGGKLSSKVLEKTTNG